MELTDDKLAQLSADLVDSPGQLINPWEMDKYPNDVEGIYNVDGQPIIWIDDTADSTPHLAVYSEHARYLINAINLYPDLVGELREAQERLKELRTILAPFIVLGDRATPSPWIMATEPEYEAEQDYAGHYVGGPTGAMVYDQSVGIIHPGEPHSPDDFETICAPETEADAQFVVMARKIASVLKELAASKIPPATPVVECPDCNGSGVLHFPDGAYLGVCEKCGGTGRQSKPTDPQSNPRNPLCPACDQPLRVREFKKPAVDGITDGEWELECDTAGCDWVIYIPALNESDALEIYARITGGAQRTTGASV